MHELHQLAVKREQLQIKLLEKQLEDQSLLNKFRLDNEQEVLNRCSMNILHSVLFLFSQLPNIDFISFSDTSNAIEARTGPAHATFALRTGSFVPSTRKNSRCAWLCHQINGLSLFQMIKTECH